MYRISLLLGAMLSVCTSSFALPEEGDDFQDQCTQEQVTILYYQGTAYCTASVNGINYPLSLFVEKTIKHAPGECAVRTTTLQCQIETNAPVE